MELALRELFDSKVQHMLPLLKACLEPCVDCMANYALAVDWLRCQVVDRGMSVAAFFQLEVVHATAVQEFGNMHTAARQLALCRANRSALQYKVVEGISRSGLDGVTASVHFPGHPELLIEEVFLAKGKVTPGRST